MKTIYLNYNCIEEWIGDKPQESRVCTICGDSDGCFGAIDEVEKIPQAIFEGWFFSKINEVAELSNSEIEWLIEKSEEYIKLLSDTILEMKEELKN